MEEEEDGLEEPTQESEEEEEEEEVPEVMKVSSKECLLAIKKVRSFCQLRNFSASVHHSLKTVENEWVIEATAGKAQKRITDYFQ